MTRAVLTAVLLLAFVAQAADAARAASCPMLERASTVEDSGCEHCPPPPPDVAMRAELPDCCALHVARVEPAVSEPVRAPHPASSVAIAPPRLVESPVAVPLPRAPLPLAHAPAPPPPPRNLPLLS